MGLVLFFCLISHLLVLPSIFNACFQNPPLNTPFFQPKGRPGSSDVSPLSGIPGLSFNSIFLSAPLLFCLILLSRSFCLLLVSALGLRSRNFFELFFSRDRFFCIALVFSYSFSWEMIRWTAVSVACYLMAPALAIYAFRHLFFHFFS